jgi:predicted PurR-regulated permease PerM
MPSPFTPTKDSVVPRVVSFIVLLAILALMGAVFFQVMAHFVVPLFLAAVLVVVFKPLHAWVIHHIPGYPKLAALATTLLIMLAVILPTAWLGWRAALEGRVLYEYLYTPQAEPVVEIAEVGAADATPTIPEQGDAEPAASEVDAEPTAGLLADNSGSITISIVDGEPRVSINANSTLAEHTNPNEELLGRLADRAPQFAKDTYREFTGAEFSGNTLRTFFRNARGAIGSLAIDGAQLLVKLVFGAVIMVLALYYFLADGPKMLASMMKLSPLDDVYERELLDKFANISRAVVVASLASAVAQGLLAGAGYYFALNEGAPVFLLTMLTMVLAIVPFAGAAAIWIPTAVWIYLYQPVIENGVPLLDANGQPVEGDTFPAICLAIYGVCVVSAIDNVIKPLVLHGQSNLHPLVALISILGGVQTLGPIGILVGPMLVAFIQALLNMINKELLRLGDGSIEAAAGDGRIPLPPNPATAADAEALAAAGGVLAPGSGAAGPTPEPKNTLRSRLAKRARRKK